MSGTYSDLAFTEQVRAAQSQYGSRGVLERLGMHGSGDRPAPDPGEPREPLGVFERDFIQERDGFYLATTSSTGWPYVQFRGGPPGFVHVPDEHTLQWADFRGNRQYVSTGNLLGSDKVSLFFMDYARQTRLKLFGHARVVDVRHDAAAARAVAVAGYRAIVERVVSVEVAAYDWNCPRHITRRWSLHELEPLLGSGVRLGERTTP